MPSVQRRWFDHLQAATRYNQWIFSQISPYLRGNTLEIGCGSGNFTALMAPVCPHLTAIDVNAEFVEVAIARLRHQSHVKLMVADITTMRHPQQWQQAFDTIILLDVLEHIADDVALLRQLRQWLAPQGRLILKVPALNRLYNSMDEAVGHYRRYTPASLKASLDQGLFENPQLWYFNMAGIPGWWFNGSVLRQQIPSSQQVAWFDRWVPLFQMLEAKLPCPLGLSMFAIATCS